jgi:hypothetical protein
MFTALLDTCVLYPSMQRDFLLSLAIEGMYRPIWSSAILREIEYVEHAKLIRQGIESTTACERAQRLVTMMRTVRTIDDILIQLSGRYGMRAAVELVRDAGSGSSRGEA